MTPRRNLLKLAAAIGSLTALPRSAIAGAIVQPGLQVRKLSWAGILIETENTALFSVSMGASYACERLRTALTHGGCVCSRPIARTGPLMLHFFRSTALVNEMDGL